MSARRLADLPEGTLAVLPTDWLEGGKIKIAGGTTVRVGRPCYGECCLSVGLEGFFAPSDLPLIPLRSESEVPNGIGGAAPFCPIKVGPDLRAVPGPVPSERDRGLLARALHCSSGMKATKNQQLAAKAVKDAQASMGAGWQHISADLRRGLVMSNIIGILQGQDESVKAERVVLMLNELVAAADATTATAVPRVDASAAIAAATTTATSGEPRGGNARATRRWRDVESL